MNLRECELFHGFDVDGRNFKVDWMILRECKVREFENLKSVFLEEKKMKDSNAFLNKQHTKMHICNLHVDAFP